MRSSLRRVLTAAISLGTAVSVLSAVPAGAADADLDVDATITVPFNNFYVDHANLRETLSSPAYGDVTGNGEAEIIVGGMDGRLSIMRPDGSTVLRLTIGPGAIHSSPTLADLTGDGVLDIVVGTSNGDVVALQGNGNEIFRQRTCVTPGKPCDVYSSIAIGDIDNDGRPEVVVGGGGHHLHVFETNGSYTAGFPVETFGTTWASPALADIDGDGFAEIIIAVDINDGGHLPVGCQTFGASVRAYEHTGSAKWHHCVPGEIITASPAVADIDNDGKLEVAIGSGMFFNAQGRDKQPSQLIRVLDATNGQLEPGWPVDTGGLTIVTPAVGNIDNDPELELVITTDDGFVRAYEHNGGLKWSQCGLFAGNPGEPNPFTCPYSPFNAFGSPASIADVDNDGAQEVVVFIHTDVIVMNGTDGRAEDKLFTTGRYVSRGQPTIVEHNGEATIIVQQLHEFGGNGPSNQDKLVVSMIGTGTALGAADWPMFAGNQQRTGSAQTDWAGAAWVGPWLEALYIDLLQRNADQAGIDFWSARLSSDMTTHDVATAFATSDEWLGVVVDDLYEDILGRGPDASGRAFWISQLQAGVPAPQVVSSFFASDEYFESVGGTNPQFIDALYQAVLRRASDARGRAFWVTELDNGAPRGLLSTQVFRSYESGGLRVDGLYDKLLRRSPDAGGRDFWATYLTTGDEVALAAQLASSPEYIGNAEQRFGS